MRVASHVSEQYRRTAELAPREKQQKQTQAHARTKTTSFGFSLGKFGVSYESQSTLLDPALSRDVQEKKRRQKAFLAESEVENLRAQVGADGAEFRDRQYTGSATDSPPRRSLHAVRQALTAYARSSEQEMPMPGNMLAGVV